MREVIDMANYKCKNCGYRGCELVFQFNNYTFCVTINKVGTKNRGRELTG